MSYSLHVYAEVKVIIRHNIIEQFCEYSDIYYCISLESEIQKLNISKLRQNTFKVYERYVSVS